jgi:hypothetical protein
VRLVNRVSKATKLQTDSAQESTEVNALREPVSPRAASSFGQSSVTDGNAPSGESPIDVARQTGTHENRNHVKRWTGARHQDALGGWRVYRTGFVAAGPPPLIIAHTPAITAWSIATFLLCLLSGGWLAARQRAMYVIGVAAAAVLALVVSAAYAPLATGAFLGLLASLLFARPRAPLADETLTKTWSRATVMGAVFLTAPIVFAGAALAQQTPDVVPQAANAGTDHLEDNREGPGAAPPQPAAIHAVMIPADVKGRPVGTKWYVGERLLRELFESSRSEQMTGRDWLLRDLACEGELRGGDDKEGVVAGEWKLTLSIEVLARNTTIALPLVRRQARWAPAATLDGIPAAISWNTDGRRCEIQIVEPGAYELAISFVPQIDTVGDRQQIELSVPERVGAQLLVRYPPALSGLETVRVVPSSQASSTPGLLTGELDGSGQLTVDWPRDGSPQNAAQGLRVSELYWLHLDGGEVWLDAKYVVEGGARRPETLTVAYDSVWQLLSSDDVISRDQGETGPRRTARIALPPDDIDRQEVAMHWRLAQAVPLGNFKIPPIALASLPVTQRWFAISSVTAIQCEILDAEGGLSGTPEEFLARWGGPEIHDDSSTTVSRVESAVTPVVSVRPRTSEPAVIESLQIAAGNDGLRIQFQCEVTASGMDMFQFPLMLSEEITIDEVIIDRSGQPIPLRWSRPDANLLHIFFGQGLTDEFRITVRGHVKRNDSATYAVPRIAAEESSLERVQFYRDDDVLLEIEGLAANVRPDNAAVESPPAGSLGHVAGAYLIPPQSFSSTRLVVQENHVQTSGKTLTMLEREADSWWATFACQLAVEQGALGILRLRAPGNWVGPLEVQSDIPATIDFVPLDQGQSGISVRFGEPVPTGKALAVRIRGRIVGEPGASIAVPEVVTDTAIRGPRFVLVPSQLAGQPAMWADAGVRATLLPPEFATLDSKQEPGKCFEVTDKPFRVALEPAQLERPAATVRLTDTRAEIGPFGGQLIVTHMLLVSSELTEVTLAVPAGQDLVTVTRDGRPVLVRRLDDRSWHLALGPTHLPQSLEVICRAERRGVDRGPHIRLDRPRLLDGALPLPVEVGLWSIGLPKQASPWRVERAAAVNAAEQAALRLSRLASVVESATSVAVDLPIAEGRDWYLPWAARVATVRRHALLTIEDLEEAPAVLQVTSAQEQIAQASQQVGTWMEQCDEIFAATGAAPRELPVDQIVAAPWEIELHPGSEWIHCVADGDSAQLLIDLRDLPYTSRQSRTRDLLLVIGAAAAAIAMLRYPAACDLLCRWPHATAFMLGTAVWAWFEPSWLGLLVIAVSLWLALRPGWPGHLQHAEGSTVMRVERN